MKTSVFLVVIVMGFLLVGQAMGQLSEDEKTEILSIFNDLRGSVQPTAANMAKLVRSLQIRCLALGIINIASLAIVL